MLKRNMICAALVVVTASVFTLPMAMADSPSQELLDQTAIQTEYQRDLKRLQSFREAKERSLADVEKLVQEIQDNWSQKDEQIYFRLMLESCQMLSSFTFNDSGNDNRQNDLAQKYALISLKKVDQMPISIEVRLVLCLLPQANRDLRELQGEDWSEIRSERATLWLHAWQRVEKNLDKNFDFSRNTPSMNVVPPFGTGLPSGVHPSAVKDPQLRAEYEAAIEANRRNAEERLEQNELRRLDRIFSPHVEEYLIAAYSKPPYNTEELKRNLNLYVQDETRKTRILDAVAKKVSEADGAKAIK